MYLIKIAWNNLFFNKKRTILITLLIAIACASMLLYNGYVQYAENGMSLGYISKSGHIQIASKGFWASNNNTLLLSKDISFINNYFFNDFLVKENENVLEVSGIIGNSENSTIFWAETYDNPEKKCALKKGEPVFDGDYSIVLGDILAETLNFSLNKKETASLLVVSPENGISLSSFNVSGFTSSGVPQNDKGLIIGSRSAFIDFLGMEDSCSYCKITFNNEKIYEKALKKIKEDKNFTEKYDFKTWKDLNPMYEQVNALNKTQYMIISIIMCVLVFVAVMQSLITTFNERIREFGTMEAIGFRKYQIVFLMYLESFFLCILGIIIGIIFSKLFSICSSVFNIEMTPPGYSEGFKLVFLINLKNYIYTSFFLILSCAIGTIYPSFLILKQVTLNLLKSE